MNNHNHDLQPAKIESVDDLNLIAEKEQERQSQYEQRLYVCMGTACQSSASADVYAALQKKVQEKGLGGKCLISKGGCQGNCAEAPLIAMQPSDKLYKRVTAEDVDEIVASLGDGSAAQPVERLVCDNQAPFFTRQRRVVTEYRGLLDPEKIEQYIAAGGFAALLKALSEMAPEEVVHEVRRSGLRGRGGAGYPTGLKWSTVAKSPGEHRYVVCNADEGDPGAFMNRSVLEDYPFRVLEGMIIAAYAVGADRGYVYVRAEYPLAVERIEGAIKAARKIGLLGSNIGGTRFSFDAEVRLGAGAFVCGEETALISSIEGGRGLPRPRPPYPAESGLWGCPTLINNVETFATVPVIVGRGAQWYSTIGTEKSKGTKTFALSGRVKNSGMVEVPLGTTLKEVIFDIGGGVPPGHTFKAVQTGGPAGGCIPPTLVDTPIDYEALQELGSFMGSGGIIVMDDTSCMVDVAKFFMQFCMTESCGKCVPCRVGTVHLHDILDRMTKGESSMDELAMLEELCDMVRDTSLCGLGQGAPNPVVSTLKFFRGEYLAHILNHNCPAGVCAPVGEDLRRPKCVL